MPKAKPLTEKEQAKELVNSIYQPLGYLNCQVSSETMWQYAKDRAKEQLDLMLDEIPMYTGSLNPKWKYWDDVRKELKQLP
jgi:hypothetical protein